MKHIDEKNTILFMTSWKDIRTSLFYVTTYFSDLPRVNISVSVADFMSKLFYVKLISWMPKTIFFIQLIMINAMSL